MKALPEWEAKMERFYEAKMAQTLTAQADKLYEGLIAVSETAGRGSRRVRAFDLAMRALHRRQRRMSHQQYLEWISLSAAHTTYRSAARSI